MGAGEIVAMVVVSVIYIAQIGFLAYLCHK